MARRLLLPLALSLLASCSPPGPAARAPVTPDTGSPPVAAGSPAPDPASLVPEGSPEAEPAAAEPARGGREPGVPRPVAVYPPTGPAPLLMDGGPELEALEALYASTPKTAPDRPRLMWRLAEAYVERESRAARVMTYHEIERDRAKSAGNADRAREEAAAAAKAATARDGARGKAILYYSTLAREHPNACFGGGACIDKVLYYLAYELESASRREEARQVYGEILQRFPQSRYVPNAHLVFAEALFDEAMGDPRKLAAAEQAYREVLRVPPPDNQVAPFAHYKLSYVYQNQGNAAKALAEMAEAIEVSQQYPKILHADNLARSARADIAALYVAAGDPRTALAFLARLSGDPPGKDESLHRMLDRLVESYLDAGKLEPAILVSLDWLQRGAGAKTCDVARRIDASLAKAPPPATLQAAIMGSAPLADARARCAAKP